MSEVIERIKADAQSRLVENRAEERENLMYFDHRVFEAGESLDLGVDKLEFERPTHIVFVDEAPGMNWAHPCHYLLYQADSGEFMERVDAKFPYYLSEGRPRTLEMFQSSRTIEEYQRKKEMRVALEPGKLSAWLEFEELPLAYLGKGDRYAVFYSGGSNCRHVNDMEFLYRTLIDVYGYDPGNIYVANYDGTLNWNPESWEPSAPCNYPVDGTPFRMPVHEQGNRAGFQNIMSTLAGRMGGNDCLLVHTNNHGGWDGSRSEGFMSAWGGWYYATDFAADLATLPNFRTLLVVMEPCHAGAFNSPIMLSSKASRTVVQAAVPWDEGSAGGWYFDPWAEMWISAMAGVRGDGSALVTSPDDNLDNLISAYEAFDYAIAIDNPVMDESSVDLSKDVFLHRCGIEMKLLKEDTDVVKPLSEVVEVKELRELIDVKRYKEEADVKPLKEEIKLPGEGVKPPKELAEEGGLPGALKAEAETGVMPAAEERLEGRLSRLEELMNKLEPFIDSQLRPDVDAAAYKGEEPKKGG
jgi:hypothetical protein